MASRGNYYLFRYTEGDPDNYVYRVGRGHSVYDAYRYAFGESPYQKDLVYKDLGARFHHEIYTSVEFTRQGWRSLQ